MTTSAMKSRPLRVALCTLTPFVRDDMESVPLAALALASYLTYDEQLKGHCEVKIFPFRGYQNTDAIVEELVSANVDVYGFSCYLWNIGECIQLCRRLSARLPACRIVLGGPQVSDNEIVDFVFDRIPGLDAVVFGEGEEPFSGLLKHYLGLGPRPLPEQGVASSDQRRAEVAVYEAYSAEQRTRISPLGLVRPNSSKAGVYVNLEGSRGCALACAYCHWGFSRLRFRPLSAVMREVSDYAAPAQVTGGFFCDADFFRDGDRATALLGRMIATNAGLPWYLEADPESVSDTHASLLQQLPNTMLSFGLQSTDPKVLRQSGRPPNLARFAANLERIRAVHSGFKFNVGVMYGLPKDTLEGFVASVDFALSLRPNFLTLSKIELLPGTRLFRNREAHGYVCSPPPDYEVHSTPTMSELDFGRAMQLAAFLRFIHCVPWLKDLCFAAGSERLAAGHREPYATVAHDLLSRFEMRFMPGGQRLPRPICRNQQHNAERCDFMRQWGTPAAILRLVDMCQEFLLVNEFPPHMRSRLQCIRNLYEEVGRQIGTDVDLVTDEGIDGLCLPPRQAQLWASTRPNLLFYY
jgi:anaerobic magnesium-protoporphyrin IX monomethyl ester cyclase